MVSYLHRPMNVSYYIRPGRVNRSGTTVLMLDITWRGYRLQVTSGVLVTPKHFTPHGKKLVASGEDNSLAVNWQLGQLKLNLEKEYLLLSHQDGKPVEFSVEDMRALAARLSGKELSRKRVAAAAVAPIAAKETIWDIYEQWKRIYQHKFSAGQLKRHNSVRSWLDAYCPDFSLELLDERWVDEYVSWLFANSSLGNSSVIAHMGFFRAMLKFKRLPHDWLRLSLPANEVEVDLTYAELLAIHTTSYSEPILRQMADTYVFLSQVGIRHGDYLKLTALTPVQVEGQLVQTIQLRQSKTKGLVTVPLTELALEIWNTYHGKLPKFSNAYLNRLLKQVGQEAGLTRVVRINVVREKEYTTEEHVLYTLLTAHTARHTFGSLMLEGSGSKDVAQQGLGHSSMGSTGIYARPKTALQIQNTLAAWRNLQEK